MKLGWLALALVSLTSISSAEPTFVFLDRFDHSSRVGTEHTTSSESSRLDLHAQYVEPSSGFGGYVQLPAVYARHDPFALGSLELGPTYVRDVNCVNALVLRAGVVLPTATRDVTAEAGRLRPTDEALYLTDGVAGRLSLSWLLHRKAVFARADAGVDFGLWQPGLAHVNVGAGYAWSKVLVTGELTLSQGFFRLSATDSRYVIDELHTHPYAGGSVRGNVGRGVEPFAAFLVYLSQYTTVSLTLGIDVRIR